MADDPTTTETPETPPAAEAPPPEPEDRGILPGPPPERDDFLDEIAPDPDTEEPPEEEEPAAAAAEIQDSEPAGETPGPPQDPEQRLAELEATIARERQERERERQGFVNQLAKARQARRKADESGSAADEQAADEAEEAAEEAAAELIEQVWNDDGSVGIPRQALNEMIRDAIAEDRRGRELEERAQRFQADRQRLVGTSGDHARLVGEFDQAVSWLDHECASIVAQTGFNAGGDVGLMASKLREAGVEERLGQLYPGIAVGGLEKLILAGVAAREGRHDAIDELVEAAAGERRGSGRAQRGGGQRVPVRDHPSHVGRGRPTEAAEDRREARLAELRDADELAMTEAEFREWEELEAWAEGLETSDLRAMRTSVVPDGNG